MTTFQKIAAAIILYNNFVFCICASPVLSVLFFMCVWFCFSVSKKRNIIIASYKHNADGELGEMHVVCRSLLTQDPDFLCRVKGIQIVSYGPHTSSIL